MKYFNVDFLNGIKERKLELVFKSTVPEPNIDLDPISYINALCDYYMSTVTVTKATPKQLDKFIEINKDNLVNLFESICINQACNILRKQRPNMSIQQSYEQVKASFKSVMNNVNDEYHDIYATSATKFMSITAIKALNILFSAVNGYLESFDNLTYPISLISMLKVYLMLANEEYQIVLVFNKAMVKAINNNEEQIVRDYITILKQVVSPEAYSKMCISTIPSIINYFYSKLTLNKYHNSNNYNELIKESEAICPAIKNIVLTKVQSDYMNTFYNYLINNNVDANTIDQLSKDYLSSMNNIKSKNNISMTNSYNYELNRISKALIIIKEYLVTEFKGYKNETSRTVKDIMANPAYLYDCLVAIGYDNRSAEIHARNVQQTYSTIPTETEFIIEDICLKYSSKNDIVYDETVLQKFIKALNIKEDSPLSVIKKNTSSRFEFLVPMVSEYYYTLSMMAHEYFRLNGKGEASSMYRKLDVWAKSYIHKQGMIDNVVASKESILEVSKLLATIVENEVNLTDDYLELLRSGNNIGAMYREYEDTSFTRLISECLCKMYSIEYGERYLTIRGKIDELQLENYIQIARNVNPTLLPQIKYNIAQYSALMLSSVGFDPLQFAKAYDDNTSMINGFVNQTINHTQNTINFVPVDKFNRSNQSQSIKVIQEQESVKNNYGFNPKAISAVYGDNTLRSAMDFSNLVETELPNNIKDIINKSAFL